jgi:hypothetical protein
MPHDPYDLHNLGRHDIPRFLKTPSGHLTNPAASSLQSVPPPQRSC